MGKDKKTVTPFTIYFKASIEAEITVNAETLEDALIIARGTETHDLITDECIQYMDFNREITGVFKI